MALKIVSGGQTGVDRAALDAAKELKMLYGGWIPKGRKAEDGAVPAHYVSMTETKSSTYKVRTEWNVRDSNATLIVCWGEPVGGTLLTLNVARKWNRPVFVADLDRDPEPFQEALEWMREQDFLMTLNVAGPRKSKHPYRDIEGKTKEFLKRLLVEYESD